MKKMYEEVKVILKKSQEEMKKYADRSKEMKKLMKRFMKPYKIEKIISDNMMKLELLVLIKMYPVVNVSRIALYQKQIKRQKKISPSLVERSREEEYEIENILNRRDVKGN